MAEFLCTGFCVPKRRACQVLSFARSCYYYRNRADPQVELRVRLKDLAGTRVRYGYRRLHILLMREGWQINHKRVYRLYKQEGLSLRLKTKKKLVSAPRVPLPTLSAPMECWSMDFDYRQSRNGDQRKVLRPQRRPNHGRRVAAALQSLWCWSYAAERSRLPARLSSSSSPPFKKIFSPFSTLVTK